MRRQIATPLRKRKWPQRRPAGNIHEEANA